MILVTSITENYLPTARYCWLPSVNKYSPFSNFCLCLDFEPPKDLVEKFSNVVFRTYSSADLLMLNTNGCAQHGDFLRGLPTIEGNPVIICVDADVVLSLIHI